jgi:hypothetical protein
MQITLPMKRIDQRFNPPQTPVIANQILRYYKRDKSSFEYYSTESNREFPVSPESNINSSGHFTPLQILEEEISKINEKMPIIINHFRPLLNITEALLQRASEEQNFAEANCRLNQLRDSLDKNYTWEIQRSCRALVNELELRIDSLIDKGFILRILIDFHLLMGKLKNCEMKLADLTHQYNSIADGFSVEKIMLQTQFMRSESQ